MRTGRCVWIGLFVALALGLFAAKGQSLPAWQEKRQLPSDLEIGGQLAGAPPGTTRYIARQELLALPQVTLTVADDSNFTGPTKISGIELEELAKRFAVNPSSEMIAAICDDNYLAAYPAAYLAGHHPVLVLTINDQPPEGWPKAAEDHTSDMGPYLISNPKFTPSFKVLAHEDEAQIPWGVVRIEFRDEKKVLEAIAPRGPHASLRQVQDGFQIAQQNCFRCHNSGPEGGRKSGVSWDTLGGVAANSPGQFAAYIRAPREQNPQAQMPGNPQYDDATLRALTMYFQTFASVAKP